MKAGARCLLDSLMLISEKFKYDTSKYTIYGEVLSHHKSRGIEFIYLFVFVAGDETSLYSIT